MGVVKESVLQWCGQQIVKVLVFSGVSARIRWKRLEEESELFAEIGGN